MSTPSTSAQVPKLRLPGFEGALKHITLSDVCNGDISNGVFNDPDRRDGAYRLINVLDMFGTDRVDVRKLSLLSLGKKEFEKNKVKYGDIFFTRSSLVASGIAWSNVFLDHDENVTFDGHLMKISPDLDQHDPACLAQYFRSTPVRRQLIRRGKTGTMTTIGQDDISSVELRIPSLPEQQKIAAFLTAVDGRIEQLSRKKALLEATKKGMMQQLFTQTLRFQDDHGHDFPDWEEKTLKSICSTFKSGNGITADEIQDSGTYPVYGGNGLRGYADRFTHDGEFVLIGRQGALCGNINRTSGKSYISEHAIAVAGNHLASTDWLEHQLDHMKLNRLSESSAQPGLAVNKLEKLKLLVPSLPEQTKIAGFLSALDGKIGAVGEQMRQTQAWKKGLLQQMFV